MNLALASLLILAGTPAGATAFELTPSSSTVLIGTPFLITGSLRHAKHLSLQPPAQETDTGNFEILTVKFEPAFLDGEDKIQPVRLRVAAFALGNQKLPSLPWRLEGGDAGALAKSPVVRVTVLPPHPGLAEKGKLRDIKGPYAPPIWPWTTALLAAAALIAAAAFVLSRRRVEIETAAAEPVDTRTPEEVALADIEALPGEGLIVKEFYDRLSDILRLYLERRAGITALSMTTHDLQRGMIQVQLDPQARSLTKALLDRCDLAKFARHLPAESEPARDCQTAREIICILSPVRRDPKTVQDTAA
ncbi:MAG: hypothetical protein V3S11_06415 [Elusimicrobiota bacterium]